MPRSSGRPTAADPSSRAGRPPYDHERVESIRQSLVDAARSLFAEHGIDGVSMRTISAAAGHSARMPYRYFSSKEDILRAIWHDFLTAAFDAADAAAAAAGTADERLTAYLRAYAVYWLEHPDRFEMVFLRKDAIVGPNDTLYVDQYRLDERLATYERLVHDCVASGAIRSSSPRRRAEVMITSVHGLLHGLIAIGELDWSTPDDLLRELLATHFVDTPQRGNGATNEHGRRPR